jgi:hypothetical protein
VVDSREALRDPLLASVRPRVEQYGWRVEPKFAFLQRFRETAQANQRQPHVLAMVARVLRHDGLLTSAEADWLESAGPAWTDRV